MFGTGERKNDQGNADNFIEKLFVMVIARLVALQDGGARLR
jgi:hypothetical protein